MKEELYGLICNTYYTENVKLENIIDILNDLITDEKVKSPKPEYYGIKNYKFNDDGTLDVYQDIDLWDLNVTELPFKFGKVDGNFTCHNVNLISLKGFPKIVNGDLDIHTNKLKSLEYISEVINGDLDCNWNQIEDFKYFPKIIKGDVYCRSNNLKSLKGLNFKNISGKIYVDNNPDLIIKTNEIRYNKIEW